MNRLRVEDLVVKVIWITERWFVESGEVLLIMNELRLFYA
jgi:hypothetical protein